MVADTSPRSPLPSNVSRKLTLRRRGSICSLPNALHVLAKRTSKDGTARKDRHAHPITLRVTPKVHAGGEAMQLDEADRVHEWKMVKRGRFAFVEKPEDARLPRRIDSYAIKETRGEAFRLDPKRKLFSLHYKNNDNPPDLHLTILQPCQQWLAEVMMTLVTASSARLTRVRSSTRRLHRADYGQCASILPKRSTLSPTILRHCGNTVQATVEKVTIVLNF